MPFLDHVPGRQMGRHDREFVFTTGCMAFLMGLFLVLDPSSRNELFLGPVWPWFWMWSGLTVGVYAIHPHSPNLHALGGSALTVACVGRAFQLALALGLDTVPPDRRWRTAGAVILFLLLGRLVKRQWATLMPVPKLADDSRR